MKLYAIVYTRKMNFRFILLKDRLGIHVSLPFPKEISEDDFWFRCYALMGPISRLRLVHHMRKLSSTMEEPGCFHVIPCESIQNDPDIPDEVRKFAMDGLLWR